MRGGGLGCSFESRIRSRSPISARIAALMSELRLRAFRMKSTSQVVAPPRRKYAGAGNSFLPKCELKRARSRLIAGQNPLLSVVVASRQTRGPEQTGDHEYCNCCPLPPI